MKILVTGGAGFIGSHVADAYCKAGYRVIIIDNLTAGSKRNVHRRAKFYKADVRNLAVLEKILGRERPDVVNHHAALVSVTQSLKNPSETLHVNVLGTVNVALAFGRHRKKGTGKFIFASTGGAIYGEPEKIPVDETAPTEPFSPYGLSKLLAEETIAFYGRHFDFPYLIFRYANVYGPRQNPESEAGVVAIFGKLMREGRRPTIFGDGTKERDYLYVDDVARANLLALRKGQSKILNLSWGKPVSDQTIFDTIAKELRFGSRPIYAPYRKGEVRRITLNAKRARETLDWQPKTALAEGIKKVLGII